MIGPHEGKELGLMLAGEKRLAFFHDAVINGQDIPEEIIPENAFAPHVRSGEIIRLAADIPSHKGDLIRYVCFTLPDEEWRAHFLLWLKTETHAGRLEHAPAHDEMIGKLLGYADQDVDEFLRNKL